MKNCFPSTASRSLAAQEIYFIQRKPHTQSVGMTLFCAGLLLTTISACFLPVVSRAATAHGPETAAPIAHTTPEAQRRVFQQGLYTYHWHYNCPLAGAVSQREPEATAKKRTYMTQGEATQEALTACSFCLDME